MRIPAGGLAEGIRNRGDNGIPKTGRLIIMWRIGNSFRERILVVQLHLVHVRLFGGRPWGGSIMGRNDKGW